eukprot:TRINITY_DN29947_c0_g1_i1.p1 TRINITY_DN29947_c0_g1~~TRINITY_DN29947_c0_g1_i1.p1  ORF type:complete len:526 (+),score=90.61 TRINITY_DN29947_c0_g1_i1:70-1647(+)
MTVSCEDRRRCRVSRMPAVAGGLLSGAFLVAGPTEADAAMSQTSMYWRCRSGDVVWTRTAAEAWSCLREAARERRPRSTQGYASAAAAVQTNGQEAWLLEALRHARALTEAERRGATRDHAHPLRVAYVDVHSSRYGGHCGVILFSERHSRPCAEVLRFEEVTQVVAGWERDLAGGSRPPLCTRQEDPRGALCMDFEETLNTFEFGWVLAMKADVVRVNAWRPWPWDILAEYDLLILRVDELRFVPALATVGSKATSRKPLWMIVGTEPHSYGDVCDMRHRHYNDLVANNTKGLLESLGICPVILDTFLVPRPTGVTAQGPPALPHWWPMPLHLYGALFKGTVPTAALDATATTARRADLRRVLVMDTPNAHHTPATRVGACVDEKLGQGLFEELTRRLPKEDGWTLISNADRMPQWALWRELHRARYVVLAPFSRYSLGRAIAEAAAVAQVPLIGWRNKWFMKLLMPPALSVSSLEEIVETILRLDAQPAEYVEIHRGIKELKSSLCRSACSTPTWRARQMPRK